MEIDLSAQLKRRQDDSRSASKSSASSSQPAREVKPFQAESRRWDRSSRYGSRVLSYTECQVEAFQYLCVPPVLVYLSVLCMELAF